MRLGAGRQGTKYDYECLKGHPFFKRMNFDDLHKLKVPISQKGQKRQKGLELEERLKDEGIDHNNYQESSSFTDHTEEDKESQFEEEENQDQDAHKAYGEEDNDQEEMQEKRKKKEKVKVLNIKKGNLKKRSRFHIWQTRIFVLNSEPKLKYYKNGVLREEIPLDKETLAKLSGNGTFSLSTSKKVYHLREIQNGEAEMWVEFINRAILGN